MKLSFLNLPAELACGVERLCPLLGVECATDGLPVTVEQGDRLGIALHNGKATVYYDRPVRFFRELGLLVEHASKPDFELFEDTYFTDLSVMIDTARNGVPTVEALCRMIDRLVLMGYSSFLLYTEDTMAMEAYPYFGYMRGRYSAAELRALDDYAYAYGMEIIPCLECYGHMEKYLSWAHTKPITDTPSVLMAREEETFVFVEEMIKTAASCFRSRRVHIGMDEAWNMGRGNFLSKHGYVHPFDIFNEYMERLVSITNKYGLKPMMWSDMYFRAAGKDQHGYYERDTEIPPEVAAKIPTEVELVFWHYGEKPECDDYMLKKHAKLGRKIIYAGGTWSWIGHFPENNYVMETTRFSLNACRNNDVHEAMLTVWKNDNAECDYFADLLSLSYFAELAYDQFASDEKLHARFAATTGGDFDAFLRMSDYHNDFGNGRTFANFHNRFLGKPLFWQDVLEGLFDTHLFEHPMSGHYAACATAMREVAATRVDDPWNGLYVQAHRIFDYLAVKTLIAERLHPAYAAGDRDTLAEIANTLLPLLQTKMRTVHMTHRDLWMRNCKDVGWCILDIRYAGVVARCDTAIMLINQYLNGEIDHIDALEEVRLHHNLRGFSHYGAMATPNLKI